MVIRLNLEMRTVFGLYTGLRYSMIWTQPYLASMLRGWTNSTILSYVGSMNTKLREVGSFYCTWWMVFMKRKWVRMSQWYFGFITFLEKHTLYIHRSHIYWPKANSTWFSTFFPTKRSRKAITWKNKILLFSRFLPTYPFVPWESLNVTRRKEISTQAKLIIGKQYFH